MPSSGVAGAERLMSTLAYGWVERCSNIAGCGILHQKISTAAIRSLQIKSIVYEL